MASTLDGHMRLVSATAGNGSASVDHTSLPTYILESFLPGYSVISGILLETLGLDVSLLVSNVMAASAVGIAIFYLYNMLWLQVENYFTSSVAIESGSDIYNHVTSWFSDHQVSNLTRTLRARDAGESTDRRDHFFQSSIFDGSHGKYNGQAENPPQFEPYQIPRWFRHKNHFFQLRRERFSTAENGLSNHSSSRNEQIIIKALGRSTQPIKELILEARRTYLAKQLKKTTIRRPTPKNHRHMGALWTRVATRPSRPIETVALDDDDKQNLLVDIDEYLHPDTRQWYAERGIPYRRGYLLYGPPGTGKTSLSFAIAGYFGIDIFCLSLIDPSITEEDLGLLLSNLPQCCVVLLEDIDNAGIARNYRQAEGGGTESEANAFCDPEESLIRKECRVTPPGQGDRAYPTGATREISLSGLLNAIDGVTSHEGRVLIMTTNHPDKLDPALIRPGRIDITVQFTLATKTQIKQLFLRMYSEIKICTVPRWSAAPEINGVSTDEVKMDETVDLEELADAFADKLPSSVFSPAEVQGYLLTRKREPWRAVEEAGSWGVELLKAKGIKDNGVRHSALGNR